MSPNDRLPSPPEDAAASQYCPFCAIVRNQDSAARVVHRDEYSVAFVPLRPATLGHVLVVPREHRRDIWALDEDLAARLAQSVLRVARAVRKAVEPEGLNVINSTGEAASQTIWHVHTHVVPRWHNDAMGRIWPSTSDTSDDRMDEIAQRVRDALM